MPSSLTAINFYKTPGYDKIEEALLVKETTRLMETPAYDL